MVCLFALVLCVCFHVPAGCMSTREGGHRQRRIGLKHEQGDQVEPPPVAKWARTSRRLRQMQHDLASSSGHAASGGQSGYLGPPEAPDGQSGFPGPSGARLCGYGHEHATEFRVFVGKLYLRTHDKSFIAIPNLHKIWCCLMFLQCSGCWGRVCFCNVRGVGGVCVSLVETPSGIVSVASPPSNCPTKRPRLGLLV